MGRALESPSRDPQVLTANLTSRDRSAVNPCALVRRSHLNVRATCRAICDSPSLTGQEPCGGSAVLRKYFQEHGVRINELETACRIAHDRAPADRARADEHGGASADHYHQRDHDGAQNARGNVCDGAASPLGPLSTIGEQRNGKTNESELDQIW